MLAAGPTFADTSSVDDATREFWRPVLQRFVDDQGRVDFAGLSGDRALLDRFVGYLAQVSPHSTPRHFATREAVLAYHINAYNALAMYGVLEKGIPRDLDGVFKRLRFFRLQKFELGGRRVDLHGYENKVIRPLGEPRIHFALNCMVRDCPRLPREPFVAERLEAQLEAATREFFNKPRHIRVEPQTGTVWLSEILDFYTEDFISERTPTLIDYVNAYRDDPVPATYRVRFIRYDWTINKRGG